MDYVTVTQFESVLHVQISCSLKDSQMDIMYKKKRFYVFNKTFCYTSCSISIILPTINEIYILFLLKDVTSFQCVSTPVRVVSLSMVFLNKRLDSYLFWIVWFSECVNQDYFFILISSSSLWCVMQHLSSLLIQVPWADFQRLLFLFKNYMCNLDKFLLSEFLVDPGK